MNGVEKELHKIKVIRVRGNSTANGGPFYDVTADGKSFYVQQNLSSPSFYVSNEEYTDVVVKGMICQGSYPDCVNPMTTGWMMI